MVMLTQINGVGMCGCYRLPGPTEDEGCAPEGDKAVSRKLLFVLPLCKFCSSPEWMWSVPPDAHFNGCRKDVLEPGFYEWIRDDTRRH